MNLKIDPTNNRRAHNDDFDALVVTATPEQTALIVNAVNNHSALVAMVSELRTLVRVTGPLTTARERADALLSKIASDG